MARIRTIKPELAKHEVLYDLERETGLPIRFAWAMLPTVCDREGRFEWRPRTLKADILPHDELDFSRVLDAWLTRGQLVKYRVGNEWFGWVPTFKRHQVVNNKEAASDRPPFEDADEVIDLRKQQLADATPTRDERDAHALPSREVKEQGEGKGKEGKGKEEKKPPCGGTDDPKDLIWKTGVALLTKAGTAEATARTFLGQFAKNGAEVRLAEVIGFLAANPKLEPRAYITAAMTRKSGAQQFAEEADG